MRRREEDGAAVASPIRHPSPSAGKTRGGGPAGEGHREGSWAPITRGSKRRVLALWVSAKRRARAPQRNLTNRSTVARGRFGKRAGSGVANTDSE